MRQELLLISSPITDKDVYIYLSLLLLFFRWRGRDPGIRIEEDYANWMMTPRSVSETVENGDSVTAVSYIYNNLVGA